MRTKLRKLWKKRAAMITKARLADKWATVRLVTMSGSYPGSYRWVHGVRNPPLKVTQVRHEGRHLGLVEMLDVPPPRTYQKLTVGRQYARRKAARTR